MFEALRKLTANYTEAEYERWIESEPKPLPAIRGDEGRKDLAYAIAEVAFDTGYESDFLGDMFLEIAKDYVDEFGMSEKEACKKAFREVAEISYERDW